ncbi:hypothetical protein LSAT2_023952 [Lamellibrachia satsuma]|nr:hypothetical protein LSAT2_023952 [Lamellibrachia satsuma]
MSSPTETAHSAEIGRLMFSRSREMAKERCATFPLSTTADSTSIASSTGPSGSGAPPLTTTTEISNMATVGQTRDVDCRVACPCGDQRLDDVVSMSDERLQPSEQRGIRS